MILLYKHPDKVLILNCSNRSHEKFLGLKRLMYFKIYVNEKMVNIFSRTSMLQYMMICDIAMQVSLYRVDSKLSKLSP